MQMTLPNLNESRIIPNLPSLFESNLYNFKTCKKHDSLNNRFQAILDNLVQYYDATFARIWFVEKDRKWLILKFRSGKYKKY